MPSLLDILGYAGNLLDLPGSSVRDLLSGNNPFDQWATPFSSDNRASGRDVLRPFLGENEETGMSGWVSNPMEGVKDVAGFGLEMVADPLNFVSLSPLWRALKGRKAVKGANAAELVASKGRYGYVNAKLLADDMLGGADEAGDVLDEVANPMVEPVQQKLLGYTPGGESWRYPGREVVHHGGHNWAGSATPEHPYGMMDLDRIHTGEGNTVKGPGGYFADDIRTTDRYYGMVANKAPEPDTAKLQEMWGLVRDQFPLGQTLRATDVTGIKADMLDRVRDLSDVSSEGSAFVGIRPSGWDGTRLKYDEVWDTPLGEKRVPGWTNTGFDELEWQYELYGAPIPMKTPDPKRYTLDMPAGTKGRMMNWEGGFADQPQAVKQVWDSSSIPDLLEQKAALDASGVKVRSELRRIKKEHGITQWGQLPDDPPEVNRLFAALDSLQRQEDDLSTHLQELTGRGLDPVEHLIDRTGLTGETMADLLMGKHPAHAKFEDVTGLQAAGVPGMKNLATSTGKSAYNYAIWDKDLINQMRIRAIDEQRVPINPMFGPVKAEQRVIPQIADSPLTEVVNPMSTQPLPGLAKPAMQGAAYQALARFNSYGGSL